MTPNKWNRENYGINMAPYSCVISVQPIKSVGGDF